MDDFKHLLDGLEKNAWVPKGVPYKIIERYTVKAGQPAPMAKKAMVGIPMSPTAGMGRWLASPSMRTQPRKPLAPPTAMPATAAGIAQKAQQDQAAAMTPAPAQAAPMPPKMAEEAKPTGAARVAKLVAAANKPNPSRGSTGTRTVASKQAKVALVPAQIQLLVKAGCDLLALQELQTRLAAQSSRHAGTTSKSGNCGTPHTMTPAAAMFDRMRRRKPKKASTCSILPHGKSHENDHSFNKEAGLGSFLTGLLGKGKGLMGGAGKLLNNTGVGQATKRVAGGLASGAKGMASDVAGSVMSGVKNPLGTAGKFTGGALAGAALPEAGNAIGGMVGSGVDQLTGDHGWREFGQSVGHGIGAAGAFGRSTGPSGIAGSTLGTISRPFGHFTDSAIDAVAGPSAAETAARIAAQPQAPGPQTAEGKQQHGQIMAEAARRGGTVPSNPAASAVAAGAPGQAAQAGAAPAGDTGPAGAAGQPGAPPPDTGQTGQTGQEGGQDFISQALGGLGEWFSGMPKWQQAALVLSLLTAGAGGLTGNSTMGLGGLAGAGGTLLAPLLLQMLQQHMGGGEQGQAQAPAAEGQAPTQEKGWLYDKPAPAAGAPQQTQGGAQPAAAAPPSNTPAAQAPQLPKELEGIAEGGVTKAEFESIAKNPELRKSLVGLPPQQAAGFLRQVSDPATKAKLQQAKQALSYPGGRYLVGNQLATSGITDDKEKQAFMAALQAM